MKKAFYFIAGWFCLAMAYVGLVTPGIPFSIFIVGSAYCFARSSKRMENWIYNHKHFGPFLINWESKRVFPQRAKYVMLIGMTSSLVIMYFLGVPLKGINFSAMAMALVAIWAWRYPSTVAEYHRRKDNGEKIGWLK